MDFNEWENSAESTFTCEFGSCGIRDVYKLTNGINLYVETYLPRSPFKPQVTNCLVDFMVTEDTKIPAAVIDTDRYSPEGYGYPLFTGENSVRNAWEYAMSLKQKSCQ
jgi:hypothetical protein